MADYEIKRGVLGQKVLYSCPACGVALTSAFDNAGRSDKCPDCQQPHVVPGTKEKQDQQRTAALLEQQKLAEIEKRKAADVARLKQKAATQKAAAASAAVTPSLPQAIVPPVNPSLSSTPTGKSVVRRRRFGDGILDAAFILTRGFSVVVILASIAALLIIGLLVGTTYSNYRDSRPKSVLMPTSHEYEDFTKRINSNSTSVTSSQDDETPESDPITSMLKKHRIGGIDSIESKMRSIKREVTMTEFNEFMRGFDEFVGKHKPVSNASYWFCLNYGLNVELRDAAVREDQVHNAGVSGRLSVLTTMAMAIFGGLISFMILPLLIRIEANTSESA